MTTVATTALPVLTHQTPATDRACSALLAHTSPMSIHRVAMSALLVPQLGIKALARYLSACARRITMTKLESSHIGPTQAVSKIAATVLGTD